jgi:deazaflavin-dependent oxidoreductase (nitroreductase family)
MAEVSRSHRVRRNWFARVIGNRMARLMRPSFVNELSVVGRRSGEIRRTPVVVLDHEGGQYLLSAFGDADWVENLRASRGGWLRTRGPAREFESEEVSVEDRPSIIAAYEDRYGKMPGVAAAFRQLPDPADHATFRIRFVRQPSGT